MLRTCSTDLSLRQRRSPLATSTLACFSRTLYDIWYNDRVRARGATLIYNLPLVEWHQRAARDDDVSRDRRRADWGVSSVSKTGSTVGPKARSCRVSRVPSPWS